MDSKRVNRYLKEISNMKGEVKNYLPKETKDLYIENYKTLVLIEFLKTPLLLLCFKLA